MSRRFPVVATLVVALAVAAMIALGFWQLNRLHAKEALLARYATAESISADAQLPASPEDRTHVWFRHTRLDCRGEGETQPRAGENASGEVGWAHWAGCTTKEGDLPVMVNLGWSAEPRVVRYAFTQVEGTIAPDGIDGPRVVADRPIAGLQPSARPDPRSVPNNHLSYAVQWFLFALTALVIYILAVRKRWRSTPA
ncbi:SURF1 family protein [Tsuneonella amylolytica]|uniref:SURF1 family protein n=1 Tax=Tsuneonella amylolytica TaxID=2338327 RepID=UPI000EA99C5D|nr:SURF1 family cytochrome oxidase biogenesis protein [Tsuneonella amylolytica]